MFEQDRERFLATLRKASYFHSAISLLGWDQRTIAPIKGREGRAQTIGTLASEAFRVTTSREFGDLIASLEGDLDKLSADERRMVTLARRGYDRDTRIPPELFEAYVIDSSRSEDAWQDAKRANDFAAYRPHLQKMIDYARKFADLWGYEAHPYDAMLEGFEAGLRIAEIDGVFAKLRSDTIALLSEAPDRPALPACHVPEDRQREIGMYLLGQVGFDLEAGNLYPTEHPFSTGIHAGDVRVTTHYHEDDPVSSIFSVLHESGHGMYDQNIDPALGGTNLHNGASMGIHESQSRFWENIVGRSRAFWDVHFDRINQMAGGGLAGDAEAFFRGVNRPKRSLIRIEADELTYNLHIIIRYELEKEIASGGLDASTLRDAWNDRYEEYLGVRPDTDARGILQDVHWSGGSFGYFPTYTLGNLYGAQFAKALERDLGPIDALIRGEGGLAKIGGWLRENIHRCGSREEPGEIVKRVTGGPLDAGCLIEYLRAKLL